MPRVSLTAHTLTGSAAGVSNLGVGCVGVGDALVLVGVIRGMIAQEAIAHAESLVTDRDEGPLARTFPR